MKSTRCEACRNGDHKDCDGHIPRGFDEKHETPCLCECRGSAREREFFSEHRPIPKKK